MLPGRASQSRAATRVCARGSLSGLLRHHLPGYRRWHHQYGGVMKLAGLHHITMITGDAQKNVEFDAETLGLRLVA